MVTIEGFWRAHQIPFPDVATNKEHLALLESWMKSYKPEQLFVDYGKLIPECRALVPPRDKRMSGNPQTNGGHRTALHLPPFGDYALSVNPGITSAGCMGNMAKWTRPARRSGWAWGNLAFAGRVMEMLSEHTVEGVARGVHPLGSTRRALPLRALHPHHEYKDWKWPFGQRMGRKAWSVRCRVSWVREGTTSRQGL